MVFLSKNNYWIEYVAADWLKAIVDAKTGTVINDFFFVNGRESLDVRLFNRAHSKETIAKSFGLIL